MTWKCWEWPGDEAIPIVIMLLYNILTSLSYIHLAQSLLLNFDAFLSLSTAITGWESKNRYRIRNTLGQDVYFAAEGKYVYMCSAYCVS